MATKKKIGIEHLDSTQLAAIAVDRDTNGFLSKAAEIAFRELHDRDQLHLLSDEDIKETVIDKGPDQDVTLAGLLAFEELTKRESLHLLSSQELALCETRDQAWLKPMSDEDLVKESIEKDEDGNMTEMARGAFQELAWRSGK